MQRTAPPAEPCVLPCHPLAAERRRVAAEQEHPRLWVGRARVTVWEPGPVLVYVSGWGWRLTGPRGEVLDSGHATTHPEALAVGLAALEVASLASSPS